MMPRLCYEKVGLRERLREHLISVAFPTTHTARTEAITLDAMSVCKL
jgi:hypothetical protein